MVYNVLANAADKFRSVSVGEAALLALLGFLIVFMGIAFLVFIVWAVGKIISSKENKKIESEVVEQKESEELSEEIVAVITAAIAAYYQKQEQKCEFTVKRIKRI